MRGQRLCHKRIDLYLVADIAMDIQAAQLGSECLPALVVNVGNDDFGVFACKSPNAGLANALGPAGDDADAAGQPERDGGGVF